MTPGKGRSIKSVTPTAYVGICGGLLVFDQLLTERIVRKNGRPLDRKYWDQVRELTPREVELFDGNDHTLPVDFHSFRRMYCQALADAGVNAQLAKSLAGHSTEAAHDRYLRNSDKVRVLPTAARPSIDLSKAIKR